MHVHIVGNGSGGTGCQVRVQGWRRPLARIVLRDAGLPPDALTGDLDRLCREGVTVIAAHCATKSGLFDPEYFHVFAEMTRRYPNLYGDTSAFNVPIRGRHVPLCLREPLPPGWCTAAIFLCRFTAIPPG